MKTQNGNLSSSWGFWLTPQPCRFTPGKDTRYPFCRKLGGLLRRSGQVQDVWTPTEFDPRTVRPYDEYSIPVHSFLNIPASTEIMKAQQNLSVSDLLTFWPIVQIGLGVRCDLLRLHSLRDLRNIIKVLPKIRFLKLHSCVFWSGCLSVRKMVSLVSFLVSRKESFNVFKSVTTAVHGK
jgi:ribosomal protein L30/L7E